MKSNMVAVGCMCFFAAIAHATANRLEFYFSKQGDVSQIPAEYTNASTPYAAIGETVYLWAYVQGDSTRWLQLSLIFAGPPITGGQMYDPILTGPDMEVIWARWNDGGIKDPVGNYINLTGVPLPPVTGLGDAAQDYLSTGSTRHFLIGEVKFGSEGAVFLTVGTGFIIKSGTANPPTDDIYFGFSAPPGGVKEHIVKSDGLLAYGSDVGADTLTPDLYVIPEPAGIVMLAIAAVVRRRSE